MRYPASGWSRTLRVALPFVAGILLMGCGDSDDPGRISTEGATVQLLAITSDHRMYLLRTDNECALRLKQINYAALDHWYSLGRVDCDAARSLYAPPTKPSRP